MKACLSRFEKHPTLEKYREERDKIKEDVKKI